MRKNEITIMNKPNHRIVNKLVALILVLAIAFSIVSCSKTKSKNKVTKVPADSVWYDSEVIDFKLETDPQKRLSSLTYSLAGTDDNYIAILSDGSYQVKNYTDDLKYKDWLIKRVSFIDRATKQTTKTVDVVDVLGDYAFPTNINYVNGKLIVYADTYDPDTKISMNREYEIDPITGKVTDSRDISSSDGPKVNWITDSFNAGQYRIIPEEAGEEPAKYYLLRIVAPDGNVTELEIKESGESIFGIEFVFALDETTVLIAAAMARDYNFYKLDLKTNKLTKANKGEYSWLDVGQLRGSFNSPDGNVYTRTQEGISRLNFENKKMEKVLDFTWCAVNRNYNRNLKIVDCNDDKILLCGPYESMNMFESTFVENFVIIELTKAAKNPHAGKTIIELYVHEGEIDGNIADAIIRFNDNNRKYYIRTTDHYSVDKYMSYDNLRSDDDYSTAYLKANADLSYELASDIANGVGPDIIMNASGLGRLNNDNCLVDLSPYLKDLDSDKYFKNIIDGARTDGKLYQLPVCYTIEGIQTDPVHAGKSGIGFTTEEYKKFLNETLNGTDVIIDGQVHYFSRLFNNMMNVFIKEGMVDLTGPEFAELAGFVKDNVQQNSKLWDTDQEADYEELFDSDLAAKNNKAAYCDCPGISGYLVKRARIKNGTTMLGIPSSDGRGPMFGTKLSVAVSANAVNKDACIEFVKMMLTDEIQKEFVLSDRFVLNKEALRQGCEDAIRYFNSEEGQENMFDYSLGTYVSVKTKFTTEDLDNLENIIQSCSKADSVDAAINMILIEEMPAYFAGQKTLDQVIPVMQNRIQKVLDERK